MNRINDIRNKAIITKETMEYFQKHGQTPGFEFLTANDFRYLLSKIDDLQSQLSLSTEREERYRKALEEIIIGARKYGPFLFWVEDRARQALSSSPAPEPVTVEEIEKILLEAVGVRVNYASEKYYRMANAMAKELLTHFKITRKP